VIVTEVPTGALVGATLVMLGVGTTVNAWPVLGTPPTVTTTFPVVAPYGTFAVMLVALQRLIVAVVPLNVTVLLPRVDPNPDPAMTTVAPKDPEVGLRPVTTGVAVSPVTVKPTPLLATPPTITTTLPVAASAGTNATMLVGLQLVIELAVVPLNVTWLLPCVDPKSVPVIVTLAPTGPEAGDKVLMAGEPLVV
jgi:hypothetical protein